MLQLGLKWKFGTTSRKMTLKDYTTTLVIHADNPDKVKILSSFHTGLNIADNYGSILSALYQVKH